MGYMGHLRQLEAAIGQNAERPTLVLGGLRHNILRDRRMSQTQIVTVRNRS